MYDVECCGYLERVFSKQQGMNAATCSGFFLSGFFLSGFSLAVLRTAYFDEIRPDARGQS
jgi:hypothetical protein